MISNLMAPVADGFAGDSGVFPFLRWFVFLRRFIGRFRRSFFGLIGQVGRQSFIHVFSGGQAFLFALLTPLFGGGGFGFGGFGFGLLDNFIDLFLGQSSPFPSRHPAR